MKKIILLAFTMIAAITFNGCKKGDTGPAGTTGATGPTGATGNANVQNFSFTTTAASWTAGSGNWFYNYSLPASTNVNGAVLMYLQSGTVFTQLPFTQNGVEYYFAYDTNNPHVGVYVTSASNPGILGFKVTVIPPASRIGHPNVNYKNYEDVKKTFNLKD